MDEINILLLGETGAGKSTFINAFANYFKFNNLDDAISGELDVLITSRFTITNEDYEMKTITVIGEEDEYDDMVDDVGESSTQVCGIYVFHAGNRVIRLIDTPGVGDTRGIKYDEKNFENILKNISQHKYLNGICILLKPNNARLNITFKFCIQELLSHLHKSAKDNIVFCFTNTRGTFFRPGDTFPEGMMFTDDEKRNFASSWKKSKEESLRLLQYIKDREPHEILDTISLNNARQTVLLLREPLADIERNIQENIVETEKLKEEIQRADLSNEELIKRLYVPHIELKIIPLERPRVVCKNISCQVYNSDTSTCHVKWKKLNIFMLDNKGAMMFGDCKSCGCPAKKHKIVFYESETVYIKKLDKYIENEISESKIDQIYKQNLIDALQENINQLKEQQNTIGEIITQFTQFLMQNAIAAFNDAYVEYLDYIIHLEREKANASENNVLKGLEEIKRKYNEKVNIIKNMIENNESSSCSLSSEDILRLEKQLYLLPNIGRYLRDVKKAEEKAFKYRESHHKFPKSMKNVLKSIFVISNCS
ncbi:5397_t:CDS:2 [Gigaspora rosea]|nr:5397_t:CDS:2 [Gigaspora rosea]